jgi:diamine N-acetyltransferase
VNLIELFMDTPVIDVKIADSTDAALIADISRRTFWDSFAGENTPANMEKFMSGEFAREKLMDEVGRPGSIFLLAYQGQVPVGYVKMRESKSPEELSSLRVVEIARLYVEKECKGLGVGKRLMQRCVEIARAQNKQAIWLGVWEHNYPAHAFYQKWGFERFSDHIFILGDDSQTDWLMKKML